MNARKFSIVVTLAVAAGLSLFGQATDGNLTGTVLDSTGAAISGARVEAVLERTGTRQVAFADGLGNYRLNNLPVGAYTLTASAPNMESSTLRDVAVELNRTATVNLTLAVKAERTTVTVTDAPAAIDATTSQLQTSYSTRTAVQMPLTGVSNLGVLNLSLYSAGVSSSGGIGFGTGPSVGGQRPSNNNFMVDGIDNNNRALTGPVVGVTNEAVAEFSLLQNHFSAEFGHSTGGQFNTVVRSGGNQFHGAVYEYFQNRNLNAMDESFKRGRSNPFKPRYDQNRFGGNLGGPVRKDKLFFFGDYERNITGQQATSGGSVQVPTAEGYRQLDRISGLSTRNLSELKRLVPAAGLASGRTAMVGGQAIQLGTLTAIGPQFENVHHGVASGDYYLSDRDQIRARYLYRGTDSIDTNAALPQFYTPYLTRAHLASLTHFHTFSPAWTNELRVAFTRFETDYPVDNFRFDGLDTFPNLQFNDLGLNIGPFWVLPQTDRSNTYQVIENMNVLRGRHTLKFGYDGRKLNRSNFFVQRARGDYQYRTLERYLQDLTPEFGVRSVGALPFAGNLLSHYAYFNDEFRVKPRLTLNLGLRYEYVGVPAGAKLQRLNAAASTASLDFREPKPSYRDFAPRVGIAWSPGRDGRTAVRAGFGLSYDQIYQNIGVLSLPPQYSTTIEAHNQNPNGQNFLAGGGIPNVFAPVTDATTARARTSAYVPDQLRPYSLQWTLGVQRAVGSDYTVEVRYLGTRGVHLPQQLRMNRQAAVKPGADLLPTFLSAPSDAQIAGLTTTLADALRFNTNTLASEGFASSILTFTPQGNSTYHGLAMQATRRFRKGLQLSTGYTWSHNIDDGTTVVASSLVNPRRPQDFFDLRNERGDSALDRRHRLTFAWVWETPRPAGGALVRHVLGDWIFSGAYIAETGGWVTPMSGIDSNINGDNSADRVIINPAGAAGTGSGVRAVCKGAGACNPGVAADRSRIVGWVADNPNARYIVAGQGSFPNAGRNTLAMPGINNFDLAVGKRIRLSESRSIEFRGEAYNALNNSQFTPGYINSVNWRARVNGSDVQLLLPGLAGASNAAAVGNPAFLRPDLAFQSNSRILQLVARIAF